MNINWFLIILLLLCWVGCHRSQNNTTSGLRPCAYNTSDDSDSLAPRIGTIYSTVRGALLGTRFTSLEELKSVIQIEYFNDNADSDSTIHKNSKVWIRDCSNGEEVVSVLEPGITQGDLSEAENGSFWDRLSFLISSPHVVINRFQLNKVQILARRWEDIFGEGDAAFYDLAETAVKNINTEDLAYANKRDSTDKGYLNSFNHITAQALITSCFSEKLADFVGDAHERDHCPQLINGKFSEEQVKDLGEGPVDNYVDLINNKWGQELGKALRKKYNITRKTYWTPELLANYLNDVQSYYSWAFQIGFKPVRPEDEVVISFSKKLNLVLRGGPA